MIYPELQGYIGLLKREASLKNIDVVVTSEKINFDLNKNSKLYPVGNRICLEYQNDSYGCLVEWKKNNGVKKRFLPEMDYIRVFTGDFESLEISDEEILKIVKTQSKNGTEIEEIVGTKNNEKPTKVPTYDGRKSRSEQFQEQRVQSDEKRRSSKTVV